MNKAITIILNETSFEIEDAAYEKLKNYLLEVEKYFSEDEARDEIIKDIENNFASKLEYKLFKRKQKIVLEKDIDELISVIGKVEDFENESDSKNKTKEKNKNENYKYKKLYRNPDDFILAGVCSGLASYLDVESNIVRIIFVIFTLFTGFFPGLIIYFVLWAIVPLATTSSQKLEMNGENINLQNIKEKIYQMKDDIAKATINEENKNYIKQKVKNLKNEIEDKFCSKKTNIEKINKRDNIITTIFKIILLIIGISFICSAIFGFIGLLFGTSFFVFNPELISNFINLEYFSFRFIEVIFILGILAALIPLIFILKIGLSLLKRKNVFKLGSSIFLLVLWVFVISSIIFISLRYFSYDYIRSNNVYSHEEILNVADETNYLFNNFRNISINGPYNIKIKKGDNFKITSNGPDFMLENTSVSMEKETLKINSNNIVNAAFDNISFEIELPEIDELKINGYAKVDIDGFDKNENFKLNINGASSAVLNLNSKNLNLNLNGFSKIKLKNDLNIIDNLNIEINGASNADLSNIKLKNADIKILGASYLKINVEEKINIKASGVSTVEYYGNPVIKKQIEDLSILKKAIIKELEDSSSGEF